MTVQSRRSLLTRSHLLCLTVMLAALSLVGCDYAEGTSEAATPPPVKTSPAATPTAAPASPEDSRAEALPAPVHTAEATPTDPAPVDPAPADPAPADPAPADPAPADPAPDGLVIQTCADAPKGMSCVQGGPFIRGADNDPHQKCDQLGRRPRMKSSDTKPQATVWLQTFYMDQTEVTNAAYQACLKSRKCNKARPLYRDYDAAQQPMTGVSWHDAVKFCEAQGKHLPTEAEWEAAARGPNG